MSDAKSLGIHVVVSAGNAGEDAALWCPAACSDVITVGSMNDTWNMSLFSNFGTSLDLFAPGERVLAANVAPPSWSYWQVYGTSASTALVSGVIAYLLGKDGYIDPDSMLELLQDIASKDGLLETLGSSNLVVYNGEGF
jgi:subtilisin family serine protease